MGTTVKYESGFARYVERANRVELLDRETEHALALRTLEGDEAARKRLLAANLRYVVAIALRYRRYGTALADLVSEGNVGLCIAATKFDPSRGTRFVTYAGHWIRAHMIDHVLRSRTLVGGGAGVLRSKVFFRLNRERARLEASILTPEERRVRLADAFGTTEERMDEMLTRLDARDVSLDTPLGPDGGDARVDVMPGANVPADDAIDMQNRERDLTESVGRALSRLDERERRIVLARGMGDEGVSLAELAREFGVSRERARQLESRAHGKLRREFGRFVSSAA